MHYLEGCRLSNPREFWGFLKPERRNIVIPPASLI